MIAKILLLCLVVFKFTVTSALTAISCENYYPKTGSDAICTCVSSNNIQWKADGIALSSCTSTAKCSPLPAGYNFQVDNSDSDVNYKLTVQTFAYSKCAEYTCTDLADSTEEKANLSISDFDRSSVVASEPGENKDGTIQVTTGCVFPADDITVTWLVQGCEKKDLNTVLSSDRSTCTNTCNSLEDKKVSSNFTHTEYKGSDYVEIQYKAVVNHKAYTDAADIFTWTSANYHIKGCPDYCEILAVLSAVLWVMGKVDLAGLAITKKFVKKTTVLYILDGIDFGLNVLSLIFGAVVQDCNESKCCPDWIKTTGLVCIVISVLGLIVDIVIAYLIKKGIIRPGRIGEDRPDSGQIGRSVSMTHSRVHANPGNEGSLSHRPMPAIPTRRELDNKGYYDDDDHPINRAPLPERRAGALKPL